MSQRQVPPSLDYVLAGEWTRLNEADGLALVAEAFGGLGVAEVAGADRVLTRLYTDTPVLLVFGWLPRSAAGQENELATHHVAEYAMTRATPTEIPVGVHAETLWLVGDRSGWVLRVFVAAAGGPVAEEQVVECVEAMGWVTWQD